MDAQNAFANYYWSDRFDPISGTSIGSIYFHSGQLWDEINKNLGWVRASFVALALYIFVKRRSHWRGWTMGVPAAIVLAGLAMGLGVYFGMKAVGSEIEAGLGDVGLGDVGRDISDFGPMNATVTLETTSGIDVNVTH